MNSNIPVHELVRLHSVNCNYCMLVSIITVCFNSEKYIEQTILSIIDQKYDEIEYIIIDGHSQDRTLEIINKYAQLYPSLIQYISEPDSGIYNAMNKGLAIAKGELIGIINSDDWYEEGAVEEVVNAYKRSGSAVYHGIQRTYFNEEIIDLKCTSSSQLHKGMIEHPTCFVPKYFYDQYGFFDEAYRYVADYEFMLRLQRKGVPFIVIEDVLANFREGGASHRPEAVYENYRLWLRTGLLSKREYMYRSVMDRIRLGIRGRI